MKICLIGPYSSHPGENGTVTHIRELNGSLLKRGHSTTIITWNRREVKSLPLIFLTWLRGLSFIIFGTLKVLLVNRREHFDVFHAFYMVPFGLVAAICGKIARVPVVVTCVGSDLMVMPKKFRYKVPILLTGKSASRLICLTKSLKRAAINIGINAEKIAVIPHGVDLENINTMISKAEARRKLGLPEKLKVILFIGRLISVKRTDLVIRAFKKVLVDTPDAYLVIVGDGPLKTSLRRLSFDLGVQNSVRFEGPIPHKNVQVYYDACDVFVLTSSSEGLPAVIVEAMASMKPVIASAVGGIPELITNDVNGILINGEDNDALATSINLLLSSPAKYQLIIEQGLKTLEKYDWNTLVKKIENVYNSSITE